MQWTLLTNNEISSEQCLSYIDNHLYGTIFHTPYMFDVYRETPNYEPFAYYAVDEEKQIKAMLSGVIETVKPGFLSGLSKRAVMLQAPIFDETEALDYLLSEYSKIMKHKVVYSEIRNQYSYDKMNMVMINRGFEFTPHYNFIVDCIDPDNTWKRISESKRRQIKKALKNGSVIEENPDIGQIKEFYKILDNLYKIKVKKPLAPFQYFQALYDVCVPNNKVKFLIIMKELNVIGGIVCPISNYKFIHENYIAGLDQDYKDCYPSVMATWAAIDYACRNGIEKFDFMGAGSPGDDYGVREFKEKFGGELIHTGRYIGVHSRPKYWIANYGFKLYQKLKYK